MTVRALKAVCLLLFAATLVSACGYRPIATRGPLAEADGVNVVLFQNKSYRPGLPGQLARDLVDQLALRSAGKVLAGDQAHLELTGAVLSYAIVPVSYSAQDVIKEYKSVIAVQAVLKERATQKVLWKADLTEDRVFPVNANIALQQNAEEAAIASICRRLSEEIWQKIGSQF